MSNSDRRGGIGHEAQEHVRTPAIIVCFIIAFLGIIFLSFFAHWYEVGIMESVQPNQVIVNALPPMALFMMTLVVIAVNPLLKLISRDLALGPRELLVIITLWLSASVICFSNFMMPHLMSIGSANSTMEEQPVVSRVGLRDYLNHRLYLPPHAADEYYLGKSPDGRTRVPPFAGSPLFRRGDFRNIGALAERTTHGDDTISIYMRSNLSVESREALQRLNAAARTLPPMLVDELNGLIDGPLIYDEEVFAQVSLTAGMRGMMEIMDEEANALEVNRRLLERAFPGHIAAASPEREELRLETEDLIDAPSFAEVIYKSGDGVGRMILERMSGENVETLRNYVAAVEVAINLTTKELNRMIRGPLLLGENGLHGINFSGSATTLVNRALLESSYQREIRRSAIPVSWPLEMDDLADSIGLAVRIAQNSDPLARYLRGRLSDETLELAVRPPGELTEEETSRLRAGILADINGVVSGALIYQPDRFADLEIDDSRRALLNRVLLQEGYSRELASYYSAIPWGLWLRRAGFWGPFMALMLLFSVSLCRIMHRQWSERELLTYPLSGVIDAFLRRDKGGAIPDVFHSKIFWVGFVGVAIVYIINGLHLYFPLMINIPTIFFHTDLLREFEFLARYSGREAYALLRGFIYPFIISLAVLLPADLSLTSWLCWVAMVFVTGFYFFFTGDTITETDFGAMWSGMYIALALLIIMIGRREYARIFKCAVTFSRSEDESVNRSAWACRLFLLSFAGLVVMFVIAGMDWLIAIAVVLSFGLLVLLLARLTAETGIPWLVNMRALSIFLPLRLLGAAVIGPQSLAVMATVAWPLDVDTSNSIAAQETTYIKNRERYGGGWLTNSRFNIILAVGMLVAIIASGFFHLWNNYTFGSRRERAMYYRVSDSMRDAANQIERLKIEGMYEQASEPSPIGRLANFQFNQRFWSFFIAGAGLVMIFAFMRLRFSWWPFHPLPLLFVNTWAMSRLYTSIFIGWVIKTIILRVWGGKTFANLKPFFLGVIIGQATVLCIWVFVGAIYFISRGTIPPRLIYMWL